MCINEDAARGILTRRLVKNESGGSEKETAALRRNNPGRYKSAVMNFNASVCLSKAPNLCHANAKQAC